MVELLQWSEEQMLTARTGVLREKKEVFGFWVHLGGREDWWVCDEGQRDIKVLKNNSYHPELLGSLFLGKAVLSLVASLLAAPVLSDGDKPSPVSPLVSHPTYRAGSTPHLVSPVPLGSSPLSGPPPPMSCAFKMGREGPNEIYLLKVLP